MVVVDTNIISELMRTQPSAQVLAWMDDQPPKELFVTAVTEAAVRLDIASLPEGRRHRNLVEACDRAFGELFSGRVLPFDRNAAQTYAQLVEARQARGCPVSQSDGQIAAIARVRSMRVATRNTRNFEHMGVDLIDPWNHS